MPQSPPYTLDNRAMQRETLEHFQVLIYVLALLAGWLLGWWAPAAAATLEWLLWPLLALLLLATFAQTPLKRLPDALRDKRLLGALVLGNFVLIPAIVAALLPLVGSDTALKLGVVLVLCAPCTDWFITFTQLGRGDVPKAIAWTPLALVLQLLWMPVCLWWLLGSEWIFLMWQPRVITALVFLIVTPLLLAWALQATPALASKRMRWTENLAWLPVPLLALVMALIAATQTSVVQEAAASLARPVLVFVIFALLMVPLAKGLTYFFKLPAMSARVLLFSLGTRNSFVVLPLALALGSGMELTSTVIVVQSIVELILLLGLLAISQRWFPDRTNE